MMVAWHEMPGNVVSVSPSRRVRYDRLMRMTDPLGVWTNPDTANYTIPYGTDHVRGIFQAFHAWLPSIRPGGTKRVFP
jgi:hypothetical protein